MDYIDLTEEDKERLRKKLSKFYEWIQRDIPDTEI